MITKADMPDLQAILDLQYIAYQSEAKLLNDFSIPPLKQTYDEIAEEYGKGIFLKATDKAGNIIGSVRAHIADGTAYIGKLIVHPSAQGQGIGTALMMQIERECDSRRFELFTSVKSVKNIRLYERLGYTRFAETKISDSLTFVYLEKFVTPIDIDEKAPAC